MQDKVDLSKNKRRGHKAIPWLAIIGVLIALLTWLIPNIDLPAWIRCRSGPKFYISYEGAFDPNVPEYEVAYPMGWGGKKGSAARIIINADCSGKEHKGPVYIKIQPADESRSAVTVAKWDDFSNLTAQDKQKTVDLSFDDLFSYAGFSGATLVPELDSDQTQPNYQGNFELFIEHEGNKLDRVTVNVLNTPWFHTVLFSGSEGTVGDKVKAYVTLVNLGTKSEFVISSCVHEILSESQTVDLSSLNANGGWWPEKSFTRKCNDYRQESLELDRNQTKVVAVDIPQEWVSTVGVYTLMIYMTKKLPIYKIENGAAWKDKDSEAFGLSRDSPSYSMFVVLSK